MATGVAPVRVPSVKPSRNTSAGSPVRACSALAARPTRSSKVTASCTSRTAELKTTWSKGVSSRRPFSFRIPRSSASRSSWRCSPRRAKTWKSARAPLDAALRVGPVPGHAARHEAEAEEHRQRPHGGDQEERREEPEEREPGVERRAEARVVGLQPALPHHDHREALQREDEELEGARELGDLERVEQRDDEDDDRDAEHDRARRRSAAAQPREPLGQEPVVRHGHRVTRGAEDARVRHGEEREHGRHRQHALERLPADHLRRGGHRGRRARQPRQRTTPTITIVARR